MGVLAECPLCHKKQSVKNKKCSCELDLDEAKRKKKVRYWISYRLPDGRQRRESVGALEGLDPHSITDAKEALAKRQVQKKERRIFDTLPETVKTFNELAEWYLNLEKVKALAYHRTLCCNLSKFNELFGNYIVSNLSPVDLEDYQVKRQKEGYSDSYVDAHIESAKNMVTKALDNDIIGGDCLKPFRKVKNLLRKGANARNKVLTYQEYKNLLDATPNHSKAIVVMGFWTGMRRGEILNLKWSRVDLSNRLIRLKPSDTKEGKSKNIPISNQLLTVLAKLPNRLRTAADDGFVFTYAGKPIRDIRDGIKNACKKAEIPYGRFEQNGFIFHDLRRTAKTNARKSGVDKNVRMAWFGHSSGNDMDFRYDIVDEEDLIKAVDQMEAYLEGAYLKNVDHSVDQGNILEGSEITNT